MDTLFYKNEFIIVWILYSRHTWITLWKSSCLLQITRRCIKWNINSTAHIMTKRAHLVPLILQQATTAMQHICNFGSQQVFSALLSFSFSEFSLACSVFKLHPICDSLHTRGARRQGKHAMCDKCVECWFAANVDPRE